jgi:hypothetical protein
MRLVVSTILLWVLCGLAVSQSPDSDEALLKKTRALYDAPFTRNLVSFDCSVQFDWKQHTINLLGTIPPALLPTVQRLQAVQHRVFVDRSGATFSALPKAPDFAGDERATQLEQVFNAMASQGFDAWLPFSTNVILPMGTTKFSFQESNPGYKLTMSGPNVAATLLLDSDLRVTSGVSHLPQDLRFTTEFRPGPDGFLLQSVRTGSTSGGTGRDATFAYTYQVVQGFQLPLEVTVSPATTEPWKFTLADCKVVSGIVIHVASPANPK